MKKILTILLALVLMLSLAACGADTSDDYDDNDQNIGGNDAGDADDADVCYECGEKLDSDDEGWMSSVYDENSNMIDVYICDDCWEADEDADVDAGATDDADVDAGATEDADDADETTKGGYTATPQYSSDNFDDNGELYECNVCGKQITESEACIEASVVGTKIEKTYYCPECFED